MSKGSSKVVFLSCFFENCAKILQKLRKKFADFSQQIRDTKDKKFYIKAATK